MAIIMGPSLTLAVSQSLAANWTSDIIDSAGFFMGSIEYHIDNNDHVGVLDLLAGNIPDVTLMQPRFYSNKAATTVTSGSLAITAAAAFDNLMTLNSATERYWCLRYTFTSGSGTISAYAAWKGVTGSVLGV